MSNDLEETAANGGRVPLTALFSAMGDQRRRYLLYYLLDHDPAEVDELTTQVCAWEHGATVDEVNDEDRRDVRISLHHNHLPKLAASGIIDYDQRSGTIRFHHQPEIIERILSIAKRYELGGS